MAHVPGVLRSFVANPAIYPGPRRSSCAVRTSCSATAAVQVAVPLVHTAPRRTPLASPSLLPVPGREPTQSYGPPLRGSPEPLGVTYDKEVVRNAS